MLALIVGGLSQASLNARTTNNEEVPSAPDKLAASGDSEPGLSRRRRSSATPAAAHSVRLALGSTALRDSAPARTIWGGVTCYAIGRRTRDEQLASSPLSERSERPAPAPFVSTPEGPGDRVVASVMANELAKVERTPTVAEAEYQVETTGRPGGEVIAVQLLPGGEEIVFAPFVEGFREPDRVLSRAGGRLIEGTAGLLLVTRGRWLWRVQLSHRFSNSVLGGELGSDVGLMVLRRF